MVKSTVEILQNFVAFSEYINFIENDCQDPMKKLGYAEFNGEQSRNKKWSDILTLNEINLEARR